MNHLHHFLIWPQISYKKIFLFRTVSIYESYSCVNAWNFSSKWLINGLLVLLLETPEVESRKCTLPNSFVMKQHFLTVTSKPYHHMYNYVHLSCIPNLA